MPLARWDPGGREAIARGSRHPCRHIITAARARQRHRQQPQPGAPVRTALRRRDHTLRQARPGLRLSVARRCCCHRRRRPPRPAPPRPPAAASCLASLPQSRRGATHCPAPAHGPVVPARSQAASALQRTHLRLPTSACTRLATLSYTLPRPPSRCTTRCDAWLTRAADSPPFRQTCLLASIAKHCSPLLRPLRVLRLTLVIDFRFPFRATALSQAAVRASPCVASPDSIISFERALH